MSLEQHVAILAHSSLDMPRVNRLNPQKPAAFYAQLCFPPEAGADLQALAAAVAPGGNFDGLEIGVKMNSALTKPVPGVPGNWFVVRSSTQFAPYVADGAGNQLDQGNPNNHTMIRQTFYAGKRVRVALSAFPWTHAPTGRRGISFNLTGIMASDDGERLNIGANKTINAFAAYADPSKAAHAQTMPGTSAQAVPQGPAANPFGAQQAPAQASQQAPAAQPAQSANPFAQQAPAAQSANPFATSA